MMPEVQKFNIVTDSRDKAFRTMRSGKGTRFLKKFFGKPADNKRLAFRAARLDNRHLFFENSFFGGAQHLGMFKPDARHDSDFARSDRRTVETPAHARFHRDDIDALFRIIEERHQGQDFKVCRFKRRFARSRLYAKDQAFQIIFANRDIVNADSFAKAHQVRARKEARLISVRLKDSRQVVARRALAVRSDDMDGLEFLLRVSKHLAKLPR